MQVRIIGAAALCLLSAVLSGCAAPKEKGTISFADLLSQSAAQPSRAYTAVIIPADILLPPAVPPSAAWQQQLAEVKLAQKSISAADEQTLKDEAIYKLEQISSAVSSDFTAERLPVTFQMLRGLSSACSRNVAAAKAYWSTLRPFRLDKEVRLLVDAPDNGAYPSGNAACSRLTAEVIGQLIPQARERLRDRAAATAQRRIQAGVHYPQDIQGGQQMAMLLLGALQSYPPYQRDFVAAADEIRAVGTGAAR